MDEELVEKLFKLRGHISRKNINTLQKYTRLASEEKNGESIKVVDIGTCAGKSAITMATAVDKCVVWTVDPVENYKLKEQAVTLGVGEKIRYFKMTSEEFYPLCPQIDMCFIDGLHTYEGVRKDIIGVVQKVKTGGYVLFHDTNLYENAIGRAVREGEGIYYKFIELAEGEAHGSDKAAAIYVARRI